MKKNEFEKLDHFMNKHAPSIEASPKEALPLSKSSPWFQLSVLTMALAGVILWTSLGQRTNQYEEALAMMEILNWDITEEEQILELALAMDSL